MILTTTYFLDRSWWRDIQSPDESSDEEIPHGMVLGVLDSQHYRYEFFLSEVK